MKPVKAADLAARIALSERMGSKLIDAMIAVRRLDEQYCLRWAQCSVDNLLNRVPSTGKPALSLVDFFSICLRVEEKQSAGSP